MLIIEDGTAVVDAESYVTVAELITFASARAVVLPATEPEKESLLISAIEYMESLRYIGTRLTREQGLSWPRKGALFDGFLIDEFEIPRQLKQAQLQLAIDATTMDLMANILPGSDRQVIEESVEGAVSVKYAPASPMSILAGAGVTASGAQLTRARSLLRPFLTGTGQVRVGRG